MYTVFLGSNNMEIRNFKKEDITQVLEICREVREHHINLLNGYFTPQNDTFEQSGFLASLDGTNYVALVAAQNDKIIGAVTHVGVDDPHKGYGIFITNMLEEAEN